LFKISGFAGVSLCRRPSVSFSGASNGIKKLLKGLNIHKATGPDAIPTIFLHDYVEELAPIMTFIFQLSFDTGNNIPDDWREANMVALFKKGDRHQPYRRL
jgi:hypothetical protein